MTDEIGNFLSEVRMYIVLKSYFITVLDCLKIAALYVFNDKAFS